MLLVIPLWVVAMIAGLTWRRWVVAATTGMTVLTCLTQDSLMAKPSMGWLVLLLVGITPWLLAAQRAHQEKRLRRSQRTEAVKLAHLQERARSLVHLQAANQRLESQIAQITDLYHVTKETARALRVEDLFTWSLDVIPRLLTAQRLRLVDPMPSSEMPIVHRAHRVEDGRLLPEPANPILPFEQTVLQRAAQTGLATSADASELACEWPPEVSRVAWAPLWGEQQARGVLMADELPSDQLGTLSVVANQLSLQLARIRLYQAVESMAITDTLTGLFMRRYFLELAQEELLRSTRHGLPCTVVMVDLDCFKQKNDTYGHLVGDVVLRDVAQLMKRHLRGIDLIARYGGEEFVFLLIETGADQAFVIAERLRQLVEVQTIRAYDEVLRHTVSMGLATFPDDGAELQLLIDRADEALYEAKHAGRNRVVRWTALLKE